ncbi:MAG: cadherin-like beta sandwich domain-containing protein, partial [Bacteroidales bacterium]|nr:cadherin-like beta sandwich domain-containing protein [Bacteroidales bacterium]MBN2699634.1 cadherin-like beta sandwich domain-containing protein [Bacteroidales bacterium]
MKRILIHFRLWILMLLISMLSFSRLNAALVVDSTGTFDPPLSNIHIVYAEVIYNQVDGTYIDCGFALSAMELSDWGHYATNIAFYEAGLAVRNQATNNFVRTNVIHVVPGELIKLWIVINVPAQTYRAYAKTGDMTEPLIIYDGDATFRNTDVGSGINRWTAFHNSDNNNHYLTVNTITLETNSDPTLESLTSSVGVLDPNFSTDILEYNLDVPFGTTSIQLNAVPNGMGAVVNMYDGLGNEIENGLVNFTGDGVDVEIIVTALDGTQLSYYVAIFVGEGASDARLKNLEVSVSAVDPLFDPEIFNYTVVVPVGTATV